jgi:hypothetical protein
METMRATGLIGGDQGRYQRRRARDRGGQNRAIQRARAATDSPKVKRIEAQPSLTADKIVDAMHHSARRGGTAIGSTKSRFSDAEGCFTVLMADFWA